jgi:hypothetical protein
MADREIDCLDDQAVTNEDARGGSVASSRARENSATFAPICRKPKAEINSQCRAKRRSEHRQAAGAISQQGRQLKRPLSYQKCSDAIMLAALWPWPWSKTVTTIAGMPNTANCTARLVDKSPPLSLCIVICFHLPENLSLAVLLAGCVDNT